MSWDRIFQCMTLPSIRSHNAEFSIQPQGKYWRIFDGQRQIALFKPTEMDIWGWSPFEPDIKHNLQPSDQVEDMHTVHNTVINFGQQGWSPRWLKLAPADDLVKWSWPIKSGTELEARIEVSGPDGESGLWIIHISYDQTRGQYRFYFDVVVRKLDPDPFEAFNLMCAGALADRPERRRWTHTVWENPDGKLRKIVHSLALFFCTDYGNAIDTGGSWRTRDLPYRHAWFGYAAHETFNPFVMVHHTSTPLRLGTCCQLFDEHLIWNTAGQDNLDDEGYFVNKMSLEVVNLSAMLAKQLFDAAADPVHPRTWRNKSIALPFHVNRINRFEELVDPWQAEDSPIFEISSDEKSQVQWDRTIGRGKGGSIRLNCLDKNSRTELHPIGAVCRVEPHRRYKLSGWIRTKGVNPAAFLEFYGYRYTYNNITTPIARTQCVTGDSDWTHVSVELNSGHEAYVMPRMVVEDCDSSSRAWFDDLLLEPIQQ